MKMTTTTLHLGHVAGRARLVASSSWRSAAAGFGGRGTTGVGVHPFSVSARGAMGATTDTTGAPLATVNDCPMIKRPARHLALRPT